MSLPWRSSWRARLSTSKAVSVPRRDMRSARRSSNWVAGSMASVDILSSGEWAAVKTDYSMPFSKVGVRDAGHRKW